MCLTGRGFFSLSNQMVRQSAISAYASSESGAWRAAMLRCAISANHRLATTLLAPDYAERRQVFVILLQSVMMDDPCQSFHREVFGAMSPMETPRTSCGKRPKNVQAPKSHDP